MKVCLYCMYICYVCIYVTTSYACKCVCNYVYMYVDNSSIKFTSLLTAREKVRQRGNRREGGINYAHLHSELELFLHLFPQDLCALKMWGGVPV